MLLVVRSAAGSCEVVGPQTSRRRERAEPRALQRTGSRPAARSGAVRDRRRCRSREESKACRPRDCRDRPARQASDESAACRACWGGVRGLCWIGFPARRRSSTRGAATAGAAASRRGSGKASKAGGVFRGGVLGAVFRAPRLPGLGGGDGDGGGGLAWFGLGVYLVLFAAFLTMLVYVAPLLARLLEPVARCASSGRRAASVRPLIEQHFGESAPWSLGLEEEVLILDADTLALAPGWSRCSRASRVASCRAS